ncbi:MAG: cell division protein SepF [archaeon]
MAFLEKVWKKSEELDMEDFLNNMDSEEEDLYENADFYVKPIELQSDKDCEFACEELKKGNIILLDISSLGKRNALKLREYVSSIRKTASSLDGDIARISDSKVLITPSRVKIIKRR